MYYLILTIIILVAVIIIFIIFWRKGDKIEKEVIAETFKDKQIEIKKKLIERRLEKRILHGILFIINKIKSFFTTILLNSRKIKKKTSKTIKQYKYIN